MSVRCPAFKEKSYTLSGTAYLTYFKPLSTLTSHLLHQEYMNPRDSTFNTGGTAHQCIFSERRSRKRGRKK
jgi:hypothetical protein